MFLYYVNMEQVVRRELFTTYQALVNLLDLRDNKTNSVSRLLDKDDRIKVLTASLQASGGGNGFLKKLLLI